MTTEKSKEVMLWTGRIISLLIVLFLLVDAVMKIVEAVPAIEGSTEIGWPSNNVQSIGVVLLVCTILYLIPQTNILGAILITGYLGGATAIMVRAGQEGHPYLFPIIFGVFVWAGLFLRDDKLRSLTPLRKDFVK